MSADKFMQLQADVRHNQEDLQCFLRDLNVWETNIKKSDQQLRREDSASSENREKLPPVRNRRVDTKKRRKKTKGGDTQVTNAEAADGLTGTLGKKIRAYDYQTWDKFDVDKALAELDCDDDDGSVKNREKPDEDEYETDSEEERAEMESQRKMMEATAEKEKGNSLFKSGNYEDAIKCYSRGLEADPKNALLSANRAMALLKLKKYEEAERDCDLAISLDCTYVKAFARRGTARLELGKLEDAKRDFEQVVNIETENKQAKNELKKIDRLLMEQEKERKRAAEPSNIIQAVTKPPHLRSKKPLKRMIIKEIGGGLEKDLRREQELWSKQSQRTDISPPAGSSSSIGESRPVEVATGGMEGNREGRTKGDAEKSEVAGNRPQLNGEMTSRSKRNSLTEPLSKPAMPGIPSSSYHLQAEWKRLKGHPDVLFEYFKKIPPSSYPRLFQDSLDSTLLNQILLLLRDSYITCSEPIFETMEKLSTVKRFDMNIMFMSSKEKQVVRDLFAHMKSHEGDQQSCQQLAEKYGL